MMARAVAYLKQEGVQARGDTPQALRADEAILQAAQQENADLIILGSHGRTGARAHPARQHRRARARPHGVRGTWSKAT